MATCRVQSAEEIRAPGAADPRRRWLLPLSIFAVMLVVYLCTAARNPVGLSMDAWSANFGSWRIAVSGDPTIGHLSVPALDGNPARFIWVVQDADGNDVIGRTPGVIAAGIPAYWLSASSKWFCGRER